MPGAELYALEYLEAVVKEDIPCLPKTARLRIRRAMEERLQTAPVRFGRPLRYSLRGHRRLRVGDYRVVYAIDAKRHSVQVLAIKHRKDVYNHK